MPSIADKVEAFRKLHQPGNPLLMPNPFDAGSARILEGLGFKALATTSSGFALTLGRHDYGVTRDQVLEHARLVASAVDIPVSADLENGFGPSPEDASETVRLAAMTGLAGGSIEDSTGDDANPIVGLGLAVERIEAAAEAAKASPHGFILTARAEARLYGEAPLKEIIARLKAFANAGADILFAPGLDDLDEIKEVASSVGKPLNVLVMKGLVNASIEDLAKAGVARISIGGALSSAAYGALYETAKTMKESGGFSSLSAHAASARAAKKFLR